MIIHVVDVEGCLALLENDRWGRGCKLVGVLIWSIEVAEKRFIGNEAGEFLV